MTAFNIVRITTDSFTFVPRTRSFNLVDLRRPETDSSNEIEALNQSLKLFSSNKNLNLCQRLSTIVEAIDFENALTLSRPIFEEALNHIFLGWQGFGEFNLLEVGYIRNLDNGEIRPLKPKKSGHFPAFQIIPEEYPPARIDQWLSYNMVNSDLAKSLTRSLHWRRMGTFEDKESLKFLFKWISMESLTKLNVDDDIVPKIMISFGFPTSRYSNEIDRTKLRELASHKDYKNWQKYLIELFKEMRDHRNDLVHSGFREIEINSNKLERYDQILKMATPRLQNFVELGFQHGITNLSEVWDCAGLIFSMMDNVVNDVHGTIIYTLNNH